MKRILAVLLLCVCAGCSDAGQLSQSSLDALLPGMSLSEVENAIGPNTALIMDASGTAVYQWTEGAGDSTRSIVCTFTAGKLTTSAGTNLSR